MVNEETQQYHKQYYEKHKQEWKLKYGCMKFCETCGCQVTKYNWSKHLSTKKHQKNEGNKRYKKYIILYED